MAIVATFAVRDITAAKYAAVLRKVEYIANAEDPAQDRWYQQFRALLATDPEWNDSEVIAAFT